MVLFYSADIDGELIRLDQEESAHCVRVLRHRTGDEVSVVDGRGNLYTCRLVDADPKAALARIEARESGFGAHPYHLTMAVCPTKNVDRFEWFAEKATETGVDVIAPVIGEHSERKVLKTDRVRRLVLSAAKQSLKGAIPEVSEPVSVKEFIESVPEDTLKIICYCFEGEERRISIMDVLASCPALCSDKSGADGLVKGDADCLAAAPSIAVKGGADGLVAEPRIAVLVGPEGDFSASEVSLALSRGWRPVHLGPSRLRTETAALTAVTAVYLHNLLPAVEG